MNIKKEFDEHGWLLLKDFFSPEEVQKIQEGVQRSIKEGLQTDLLSNPHLDELTILNPKIISLVKELLGETPVYIGDSDISYNVRGMSLHKDNPDRAHVEAPDWRTPYTILRMGIYLQDYRTHSGGLILRDRSHNYISRWKGKIINVRLQPGDLVLWSLRTTHSGGAKRFKLFPNWDINPYICRFLPSFLFTPFHEKREALFLSYGKDDAHMRRYIDYLKTRDYAVKRWKNMVFADDVRQKALAHGLKVKDLAEELKDIRPEDVHVDHVELKY